jgi:acetyltransferase-like isoleucine patch superfamily enzyme
MAIPNSTSTEDRREPEYFRHPLAVVETKRVGRGTRVWAFAHLLVGCKVGEDCNICDHVFVENDVVVGNRVTIKCGVQLWDGVTLEDDVFVGPNATFTNDNFPRSGQRPAQFQRTLIQRGASIGANATILPGLTIGEHAMVSAGAVITRSVPANAIVAGNPGHIVGYVAAGAERVSIRPAAPAEVGLTPSRVRGVRLQRLTRAEDLRGALVAGEVPGEVPFEVRRFFVVYDVPTREVRGQHAHRTLHQFLVCLRGQLHLMVDDGVDRDVFVLDSPSLGVHIPPLIWASQYKYSPDSLLLVLASDQYRADDYIRDYAEFLKLRAGRGQDYSLPYPTGSP